MTAPQQPDGRSIRLVRDSLGYRWCCSKCLWFVPFLNGHGKSRSSADAVYQFQFHDCAGHQGKTSDVIRALQALLEQAVRAAHADKGTVQLLNPKHGGLEIVGYAGFPRTFVEHFAVLPPGVGTCGVSLDRGERVILPDVFSNRPFSYMRDAFADGGIVGCQSTPIVSASGDILGVMSTHFAHSFELSPDILRSLDAHARSAAQAVEDLSSSAATAAS